MVPDRCSGGAAVTSTPHPLRSYRHRHPLTMALNHCFCTITTTSYTTQLYNYIYSNTTTTEIHYVVIAEHLATTTTTTSATTTIAATDTCIIIYY